MLISVLYCFALVCFSLVFYKFSSLQERKENAHGKADFRFMFQGHYLNIRAFTLDELGNNELCKHSKQHMIAGATIILTRGMTRVEVTGNSLQLQEMHWVNKAVSIHKAHCFSAVLIVFRVTCIHYTANVW